MANDFAMRRTCDVRTRIQAAIATYNSMHYICGKELGELNLPRELEIPIERGMKIDDILMEYVRLRMGVQH